MYEPFFVPNDPRRYIHQLAQLKAHRWTDAQTRAVFLDFSILYPQFNLMQVRRLPCTHATLSGTLAAAFTMPPSSP
jgi:hypothetical protein